MSHELFKKLNENTTINEESAPTGNPKYKKGDKVRYINPQGVDFGIKTVTGVEKITYSDSGYGYFLDKSGNPEHYAVPEENLHPVENESTNETDFSQLNFKSKLAEDAIDEFDNKFAALIAAAHKAGVMLQKAGHTKAYDKMIEFQGKISKLTQISSELKGLMEE